MLDLHLERQRQGQLFADLYDGVAALKRRYGLHDVAVQARDSLAVRRDGEREQVHELLKRYRDVSPEQQRQLPALLNSLAQLEILVGEFDAAQHDFDEVSGLVSGHGDRAEAHHNTYRAALERRDWSEALAALLRACALSPEVCEPFPLARYEPQSILGAGAFGVAFLCVERDSGERVVVKSVREDSLDRPVEVLFREVHWLQELDHPALIRVRDFGYAGGSETRPYLVLDYFEGLTLAEHVRRHGPLAPAEALAVLWPVARALQTMHGRGVLHRSLSPHGILVRRLPAEEETGRQGDKETRRQGDKETRRQGDKETRRQGDAETAPPVSVSPDLPVSLSPCLPVSVSPCLPVSLSPDEWQVKVVGAGFALKRSLLHAAASSPDARANTCLGRSVARSLGYAPPELVSRPKGIIWTGPHSDAFAFGRVCWFALTGRPEPAPDAPPDETLEPWRQLMRACTVWTIAGRLDHFGAVLYRLAELPDAGPVIDRAEAEMDRLLLADYVRVLARNPDDFNARVGRANLLGQSGDYAAALDDYAEALRQRPRDAGLFRRRGQLHLRRGDAEAALADFSRAVELEPRNPEGWSLRAAAHAQRNDNDAAIADCTEVLRLNPKDEAATFNRASAYYRKGDFEAAIADYSAVLRLDPRNVWAYGNRGKAHANRRAHDRALADFNQLLRIDPDNARAYWDRAAVLLELNRYEEALADYERSAKLSPSAALYNDRGLAEAAHGEHDKAIADFTLASILDLASPLPLMYRGNVYCDLGDLEKALIDLEEAVRLGPDLAVAWYNRANVRARRGEHELAIADYSRAIELARDYGAAYYNRGNSHAERGELDAAIADYTNAISRDPSDPSILNNRGNAYSLQGDLDSALADFNEALRLAPEDAVALFNRGNTHCRLGDYSRAVEDYTEALRLQPNHARAYNNRGNAHYDQDEEELALADYGKAIECDPEYARAYNNRGSLLAERGQMEAALADLTRAVELDPNYAAARYNLGNLHADLGDVDAALADFTETLRLDPGHVGARVDRGNAYHRKGDLAAALADLNAAVEAEPGAAAAWFNRGNLNTDRGELEEAIADYTRVIALNARHLPAYHNRGRAHARRGDYAAAIADNLEALRLEPENARTLNNLAWLWATCPRDELRDGPRAQDMARRACERTDWQIPGYIDTLAVACAECGQFEDAVRWQTQALELAHGAEKAEYQRRLELFREGRPYREA